jgi:hypothetical protein
MSKPPGSGRASPAEPDSLPKMKGGYQLMKELQKLASFQVYEHINCSGLPMEKLHSMMLPTSFIMEDCQPRMVAQPLDTKASFCMAWRHLIFFLIQWRVFQNIKEGGDASADGMDHFQMTTHISIEGINMHVIGGRNPLAILIQYTLINVIRVSRGESGNFLGSRGWSNLQRW